MVSRPDEQRCLVQIANALSTHSIRTRRIAHSPSFDREIVRGPGNVLNKHHVALLRKFGSEREVQDLDSQVTITVQHPCTHAHTHKHTHKHAHPHTHTHRHAHSHTHMHTHPCVRTCVYTHAHTQQGQSFIPTPVPYTGEPSNAADRWLTLSPRVIPHVCMCVNSYGWPWLARVWSVAQPQTRWSFVHHAREHSNSSQQDYRRHAA